MMLNFRNCCKKINFCLIFCLIFVIPFSTAVGSFISLLILMFFVINGNYKEQITKLKNNNVILALVLFTTLHLIGLLWSQDMESGVNILKKQWKFLLVPILMLYIRKEYQSYYIYTFIVAMSISVLFSYGIWFEIISPVKYSTIHNPTPFMSHVTYNPLLSVAIYFVASYAISTEKHSTTIKITHILLFISMSINMFITGGRSGQIMFFFSLVLIIFQYLKYSILTKIVSSIALFLVAFSIAYSISDTFEDRINNAAHGIMHFELDSDYSVSYNTTTRIAWTINGFYIFADYPLFGVGTGDLRSAMDVEIKSNSPSLSSTDNPHNMYILVLVQFGIIGMLSLLYIFYTQIKFSIANNDAVVRRIGTGLPILFIIANFAESYLSVHATSLFYSVITAVIYTDLDSRT